MTSPTVPLWQRFWAKVRKTDTPDGCWIWVGARSGGGYGHLNYKGEYLDAHRLSYEMNVGPVPEGKCVLHDCDNPPCIRPNHLFLGTKKDNAIDMVEKGRSRQQTMPWTIRRGEEQAQAKLTEEEVLVIRAQAEVGSSKVRLAARFGVSDGLIGKIVRREIWAHV